jgi:hypothetical protein
MRKTNPVSWRSRPGRRPIVQDEPNLRSRACETKPISPPMGRQGRRGGNCAKRTQFRGANVRNKPNLAGPAGEPGPRRAKTCKTNPIWKGPRGLGPAVRNKANLPGAPGNGRGAASRPRPCYRAQSCETNPIARSGAPRRCLDSGLRIWDCRSRTDFRWAGRLCKTNPIWGPIVRNKANFAAAEGREQR